MVWSIIWIYELKFELTPHLKTATKNYTASMVFEIIGPNDLSYFEFFSVEINKKLQECGILLKTLQMRTLKFYYLFLYVQIFWKLVVHENTNSIKVMTPLQSGNWNSIHVVSFYCFIISCYLSTRHQHSQLQINCLPEEKINWKIYNHLYQFIKNW